MMRRADNSLAVLVRLKRDEERAAVQLLRAARDRLDFELKRLETVQKYIDEYRSRAASDKPQWRELRDGRYFLLELESTLAAQRLSIEREQCNVEAARAHWLALRLQHAAVDKLIDRRAQAAQYEQRRSEQRQSDEQAGRSNSRRKKGSGI